jgi:hypothetical protein
MIEGVNLTKIYCKHIGKYRNVPLPYNYYVLIIFLKKERNLF